MKSLIRIASVDALALPKDAVVIADRALPKTLLRALPDPIEVDAGEGLKTLASIEKLAGQVLARHASKPMTIVAVGGGSVGDAVGFLASILWRGVQLWHVPTTLLAMVDSAHGGKTAVNLGAAKNQLGTFYVAQKVILVDEILGTLPLRERQDGLFELIKGLWLGDAGALGRLDADGGVDALGRAPFAEVSSRLMELVESAVLVKQRIVEQDPKETKGIRTVLNLGHTVAHALELICGLSHGQAVGWGLLAAAGLSTKFSELSTQDAARLRSHVRPLLRYNQQLHRLIEKGLNAEFVAILQRDKKRIDGRLRSVLLRAPAEPIVTNAVEADDWFDALARSHSRWLSHPIRVWREGFDAEQLSPMPEIEASKSELNRAQIIGALHPFGVEIHGDSASADVFYLREALAKIGAASGDEKITVYCGEGGTTLRFLLAFAAARSATTILYAHPSLLARPHDPLIEGLRAGGAKIDKVKDEIGEGLRVVGWAQAPKSLIIDGHISSQFASALALLGASGTPLELVVRTDNSAAEKMVSQPYFAMTLEMLRRVGLRVEEGELPDGLTYSIHPGPQFSRPHNLEIESDASSAAVWAVAAFLGVPVDMSRYRPPAMQPDGRVLEILSKLREVGASESSDPICLNMHPCPDLVPVIAVAALAVPTGVRIEGVAHLRHKESNRIEDLVELFGSVGVEIEAREDGILIPAGVQRPQDGTVETFGDHRMAMAALLLSATGATITIKKPWVVAKSYPKLWQDARRLGWQVRAFVTAASPNLAR